MASDLAQLESRVAAVDAVGGIVHAIWALARAQLTQVEELAREAGVYLDWVDEVVERLAGPPAPVAAHRVLRVFIGPERSFSGGLAQFCARQLSGDAELGLVGRRLAEQVSGTTAIERRVLFTLPGPSSVDEIEEVARAVAAQVLAHAADRQVDLCHPLAARRELDNRVLLVGARAPRPQRDFQTYSPPERVLEAAVSESVVGRLRVGLSQALHAEVRARAAAADAARQSVERQQAELASAMRAIRQEQITNELCDLYSGRLGTAL